MKRFVLLLLGAVVFAVIVSSFAIAENSAPKSGGLYTGSLTCGTDGKNRQVLIVNGETGDFEVYDIDNKGFDRKDNIEYYDCVSYNRETKTRVIYRYLIPGK